MTIASFDSIRVTISSYWNYYLDTAGDLWGQFSPTDYLVIVVAFAAGGWVLMSRGGH